MILNARGARQRPLAVGLFAAQFVLNLLWTPTFFGAHKIGASVIVILAMLILSIAATIVFARIRPAAAWLMVPYMVWISFAGVLAFSIGQLNPDAETLAPASHTSQML
jgi:tryptophan-rich sensory protein